MNLVHHHPLSLFFPPTLLHNLQTMKTTKSETRKKKKRERLLRLLLYIVLYIFIVSSCHTYVSVQHLYPMIIHTYILSSSSYIYIFQPFSHPNSLPIISSFFFHTSTHAHIRSLNHTNTLSHTYIYTGTFTTYPTPSAPNSPEETAASNARKMNVAKKSHPPKHSLSSTFTKRLPSGKICKCYSNPMVNWSGLR